MRKKNAAVDLFVEALRNENSGNFEAAAVIYAKALDEVKKIRFHSSLEGKIRAKIKTMDTLVQYNSTLHFVR